MSKRPITLDNENPVSSVREASGLSQRELSDALGVANTWVHKAEKRGYRVQLGTLMDVAEAAGFRLELRITPSPGSEG